ncbi:MAG: isoprenylcysteine carboxylmethyltransferase family protein [Bacteroidia bacterium]|nr:isoprenylcysteine carboxylmethyltransferase family protein [Bacteroidia bacterium]
MKIPARKDGIFVGIQLLLFVIYCIPVAVASVDIHDFVKYAGLVLGICGLLIIALAILQLNRNLTPFPTPKENGTLIQTGLYKVVRHPIYSGIILGAIGFGVALSSGWKIGIGSALWLLFFVKSTYEEKLLTTQYPDYEDYQQRTGRFFPFL